MLRLLDTYLESNDIGH